MKRTVLCMLALALSLLLVACSPTDAGAFAKTFSKNGFQITLTEEFTELEYENCEACFASITMSVSAWKESKETDEYLQSITRRDYAELIHEINADQNPSPLHVENGLIYFTYTATDINGLDNTLMVTMYESSDAFWIVEFCTFTEQYEPYKDTILSYAKTVKV